MTKDLLPRFTQGINISSNPEDEIITYKRIDIEVEQEEGYDYDCYFIDRLGVLEDILEEYNIKSVGELRNLLDISVSKARLKRYNKRFRIDLQPQKHKSPTHFTEHLIDYLSFNINTWHNWGRLPITITDKETNKTLTINGENWYEWRKLIKEWLNLPNGV